MQSKKIRQGGRPAREGLKTSTHREGYERAGRILDSAVPSAEDEGLVGACCESRRGNLISLRGREKRQNSLGREGSADNTKAEDCKSNSKESRTDCV